MKATLGLEAIGGFPNNPQTGFSKIDTLFWMPSPCWVAEILRYGISHKFQKEFLKRRVDYSNANSKGTRGVFCWYILESGHIYEVKEPKSWKCTEQYFCKVSEEGEIERITEKEVEAFCELKILGMMKNARTKNVRN